MTSDTALKAPERACKGCGGMIPPSPRARADLASSARADVVAITTTSRNSVRSSVSARRLRNVSNDLSMSISTASGQLLGWPENVKSGALTGRGNPDASRSPPPLSQPGP
jgi:hypothetical protein